MTKALTLSAALAAALTIAGTAGALDLRLSVETPPGHVRNQAAEHWAQAIHDLSNGDITVEVFPSGQLYNSADAIRAEIGNVLAGKAPGRASSDEITAYRSLGIAAQDLAAAQFVVNRAIAQGRGQSVSL